HSGPCSEPFRGSPKSVHHASGVDSRSPAPIGRAMAVVTSRWGGRFASSLSGRRLSEVPGYGYPDASGRRLCGYCRGDDTVDLEAQPERGPWAGSPATSSAMNTIDYVYRFNPRNRALIEREMNVRPL